MIEVELSNIWSCVSLPNLLSSEKDLFDAHLRLRRNQPGFADFLGWLGQSDAAVARTIGAVERAADAIRRQAQALVVIGLGESWLGARAAASILARGRREGQPALIFAGDRMSSEDYLALFDRLEGKDFCLHLIMPEQPEPEGITMFDETILSNYVADEPREKPERKRTERPERTPERPKKSYSRPPRPDRKLRNQEGKPRQQKPTSAAPQEGQKPSPGKAKSNNGGRRRYYRGGKKPSGGNGGSGNPQNG